MSMWDTYTFVVQPHPRVIEIKEVLKNDFRYQIISGGHFHQGPEELVLKRKVIEAVLSGVTFPIIVDVTSLCFNALRGLPGTLITSFVQKLTSEELYKLLESWEDKSAFVKYSIGLIEEEDGDLKLFQGVLLGTMVQPKKFAKGWEACFQPDGFSVPFSELPNYVQSEISERKKALRSLKIHLITREFLRDYE